MNYDTIGYELDAGVALVTLNRPEVMNALNGQMRAELLHAVRAAGAEARVLVMTGAGGPSARGRTWAMAATRRTSTWNARCATNTCRF